jgi:hypothetical protein
VTIWIVVVDPVVVQAEAAVAVDWGVELLVLGAGFLPAGADERVPAVGAAGPLGFVLVAGRVPAGEDEVVVTGGGEDGSDRAGDWLSWTSVFGDPLPQAATASSSVSPAAIVPGVRMSVITAPGPDRFNPHKRDRSKIFAFATSSAACASRKWLRRRRSWSPGT